MHLGEWGSLLHEPSGPGLYARFEGKEVAPSRYARGKTDGLTVDGEVGNLLSAQILNFNDKLGTNLDGFGKAKCYFLRRCGWEYHEVIFI